MEIVGGLPRKGIYRTVEGLRLSTFDESVVGVIALVNPLNALDRIPNVAGGFPFLDLPLECSSRLDHLFFEIFGHDA